MTIRERILQYLEFKRVTKYQFYKETGISNGFLDKLGAIGSDKCEIICSHYEDLSTDWLILGNGSMLRGSNEVISVVKPESVSSSSDLIERLVSLSGENALLKKKIEELEKEKIYGKPTKYGAVAEPISELKKGIKDYNTPIPENQLITHKK